MVLVALFSFSGSWAILEKSQPGLFAKPQPYPHGGLLLLLDSNDGRVQPGAPTAAARISADVEAHIWDTGGVSEIRLKLTFHNAPPGARWYVIASGQYFPDPAIDIYLFCEQAVKHDLLISCPDNPISGSDNVEYRFNTQLGAINADGIVNAVIDVDGYERRAVGVLTGTVRSSEPDESTSLWVPFRTPSRQHPGGDDAVVFAPLGVFDRGDFGLVPPTFGRVSTAYRETPSHFVDARTGQGMSYLPIDRFELDIREDLRSRELQAVSPVPDRADQLQWSTTGEGVGPLSYRLHDPLAGDRAAIGTFAAGVLASIGAAAALLLLEQWLASIERREPGLQASKRSLWLHLAVALGSSAGFAWIALFGDGLNWFAALLASAAVCVLLHAILRQISIDTEATRIVRS